MLIHIRHEQYGDRGVPREALEYHVNAGWTEVGPLVPAEAEGTVAEIVGRVERGELSAAEAIEAEQTRQNPRKSLMTELSRVIDPAEKE